MILADFLLTDPLHLTDMAGLNETDPNGWLKCYNFEVLLYI